MARGIVYIRVSSDEQVKGMSLEFQKADCLAYAEKKGIEIDRIFEERGESAKFADRPQLIGLLNHCQQRRRRLDALIVWKLDRLSRNQLDYYYLKRVLRDRGLAIHSATEPSVEDSSSIAGKVFETFSALQAEIDNTLRSERSKRGMAAKIEAGIYPWQPPPGYRRAVSRAKGDKKTAPDEPDPAQFPIIQTGLREYARGALTQLQLARRLDELGLASARGCRSCPQLASRMLRDYLDFYAGWLRHPWTGERVKAAHQPMISEEECLRIAAIRDGRGVTQNIKKKREHPLFPLRRTIRCADCGDFYTGSISRGHGGSYPYYHCKTRRCPAFGKSLPKAEVEGAFARLADSHSLDQESLANLKGALAGALTQLLGQAACHKELTQNRLLSLAKRRERLYEMREDGSYTKEEFLERKAELEREIDALKLEAAETKSRSVELDKLFEEVLAALSACGGKWSKMTSELRQRFQQALFPEGISYRRGKGFGTSILGPIFKLKSEFEAEKSHGVRPALVSWNQIVEDLRRLGGDSTLPSLLSE